MVNLWIFEARMKLMMYSGNEYCQSALSDVQNLINIQDHLREGTFILGDKEFSHNPFNIATISCTWFDVILI